MCIFIFLYVTTTSTCLRYWKISFLQIYFLCRPRSFSVSVLTFCCRLDSALYLYYVYCCCTLLLFLNERAYLWQNFPVFTFTKEKRRRTKANNNAKTALRAFTSVCRRIHCCIILHLDASGACSMRLLSCYEYAERNGR